MENNKKDKLYLLGTMMMNMMPPILVHTLMNSIIKLMLLTNMKRNSSIKPAINGQKENISEKNQENI